jgi:hypothetical protein
MIVLIGSKAMPMNKCPICLNNHSAPATVNASGGGYGVNCPICGDFKLSNETYEDYLSGQSAFGSQLTEKCRALLAYKVRNGTPSAGSKFVTVTSDFIVNFVSGGCVGPTPAMQAENIIRYIGDEVSRSGQKLQNTPDDLFSIIGAPNPTMAGELLLELEGRGWLLGIVREAMGIDPSLLSANLTLEGWERYEAQKRGEVSGKVGFLAMQFNDKTLEAFVKNVVKPAVKNGMNYDLLDTRDTARAGIIDNLMRTQIRDSAFVIADLTHDNWGAYWEAGYAEGLGKPVIYICEQSKFDKAKTHFDTNHCTTVTWDNDKPEEFVKDLVATLRRSLEFS